MDPGGLAALKQFVDTDRAEVVDARAQGGEVIMIPMHNVMDPKPALSAVAQNLSYFMEKVTGRGYRAAEEVYDVGFTVREPGHQHYGMKLLADQGAVVVARVAILEDETIFQRYVDYLRTGVLV